MSKRLRRTIVGLAFAALLTPLCARAGDFPNVTDYPATRRVDAADVRFGRTIPDPYRWLEADLRTSPEVRAWADAQSRLTQAYLAHLPEREAVRHRLTQIWNFEKLSVPRPRAGRLFFTRNSGLQNAASVYVQDGVGGQPRLLVDANAGHGAGDIVALDWAPSDDGRRLLYTVQAQGGDWRQVRVVEVESGRLLPDVVDNLRAAFFAWAADGGGFYYTAFDRPAENARTTGALGTAVFLHRLGTPQSTDREIYRLPQGQSGFTRPLTTPGGQWLIVVTSDAGGTRESIQVEDLSRPGAALRPLVAQQTDKWHLVGSAAGKLLFRTTFGAERERIVALDPERPASQTPTTIVAEAQWPIQAVTLAGHELFVQYLDVTRSLLRRFSLTGAPRGEIELPGHAMAAGLEGWPGDPNAYFLASTMVRAPTAYRFDLRSGARAVFRAPRMSWNPDDFVTETATATSADGTRVPVTYAHRRGIDLSRGAPTAILAYGGFGISLGPEFYESRFGWIDMGGVFAIAHTRGGAEYGKAWYEVAKKGGRLKVVQDFVAATQELQRRGVTTPAQTVAVGASNGGILVAAAANARPDLYAVVLPRVPMTDMLRFPQFTIGKLFIDELGDPESAADFPALLAYSPLHNIRAGTRYPAILVNTADTDDRVVPAHSFKYVATLQATAIGDRPHLLRIDRDVGHGEGKPTDKIIAEFADLWTFAAAGTGLKPVQSQTAR